MKEMNECNEKVRKMDDWCVENCESGMEHCDKYPTGGADLALTVNKLKPYR
jgi:hypothetical protein